MTRRDIVREVTERIEAIGEDRRPVSIRPLGNLLAVREIPDGPRSTILEIPQQAGVYKRATVLAIGPEVLDVPAGATVFANLGTALDSGLEDVKLIPESAVLAVEL